MSVNNRGKVIEPAGRHIWPHELKSARSLANAGYVVEFLPEPVGDRLKTADIKMDGVLWEIKSPRTDKLSAVERNLKRASKQSPNIVIESRRLSKLRDASVVKFLKRKCEEQKSIGRLLYIDRHGNVVDVMKTK